MSSRLHHFCTLSAVVSESHCYISCSWQCEKHSKKVFRLIPTCCCNHHSTCYLVGTSVVCSLVFLYSTLLYRVGQRNKKIKKWKMNCQKWRAELQYGLQISSKIPLAMDHSIFVTVWLLLFVLEYVFLDSLWSVSYLCLYLTEGGLGTRLVCSYICVIWWW